MLVNSNYTSKLGPTIKENWLVQIFKNNNTNNMVNDTPDLALCFATASGSTTATLKNSSNTEIPYYPVIVNKPTIRSSVDLKGFTTQTGSITLNLADTDIVIGDSKKRLLEEFGSSYQNAQVNVLSVIDDDTTNANALQIFSGKISSFAYRNNTIILSVISSRPFQGTSIPNTKTSGVIDGLDIPYIQGSFDPNTGALTSDSTNVYPVPFLRNDGSHLLFTLPDKISSGTTTSALEYYDTGMHRFVPITMTTAEKTAVTKDGSSTIKVPIDMVRTFTTLPDDLQDEAGNSNDAYVDSEGNFLGYNSNKKLTPLNRAVKENLKTYMNEFRMLTDGVNLLDGFIINVGLDFEIRVYRDYNKREVLTNCITALKDYFEIDKWTFNMPINIGEVEMLIGNIEGVQSVVKTEFKNLCGGTSGYSPIFEFKFPDKDIRGRVV